MNSPPPFFIVGCGRSGTSLLRSFLNAHSSIAIPTESLFIPDYLRASDEYELDYLISLMTREPEISEWGIQIQAGDFAGSRDIGDVIRKLHLFYAHAKNKESWGQKTPRFVRSMNLIGDTFQDAKFVHMVRDPRAVVSSLIMSDVHRSNAYHGARRWQMDVKAGLEYESANPERVLRITYEDLVRRPQETLQETTEFLGFDYQQQMLERDHGTQDYSVFYENIHANLDRELSDQHVTKWKQTLGNRDIEVVEAMLCDLMEELGYRRSTDRGQMERAYEIRMKFARIPAAGFQFIKYARQRPKYLGYLLYRKWRLGLIKDFLWSVNY